MPLDDIISLVKNEWREALLKEPEDLPVKVEIIFTQCYGHLHGSVEQSDRFKVTEFTTPDPVASEPVEKWDGSTASASPPLPSPPSSLPLSSSFPPPSSPPFPFPFPSP